MPSGDADIGSVRPATKYGEWYSENPKLSDELDQWLSAAGDRAGQVKALIAPHDRYWLCGDTAAYAYKQIQPGKIRRIFILGPSHFFLIHTCALSTRTKYRTAFGELNIDREVTDKLFSSGQFDWWDKAAEDKEHSIEMLLPYLAKVMERQGADSFTIVPVLVGAINGVANKYSLLNPHAGPNKLETFGSIFAPYLDDPHPLFLISSDFQHWGERFNGNTPYDPESPHPIHEQITNMDKEGMDAISLLEPAVFSEYLARTQNQICGRNPIGVLLQAIDILQRKQENKNKYELKFLKYSQSDKVLSMQDSTVCYAAGVLFVHPQ